MPTVAELKRDPSASPDRLRTAIARCCRASCVPVFSPHDLRHRRISLLHSGRSWAEIARFVGQRKLSITADTWFETRRTHCVEQWKADAPQGVWWTGRLGREGALARANDWGFGLEGGRT